MGALKETTRTATIVEITKVRKDSYALFDLVISVTHLLSICYGQLDSGLIFLAKFDRI
jgi:hypothetical protein